MHEQRRLIQSFLMFFVATCVFAQDAPMFRNDLAHSGIYSAAGVPSLKGVKWTFKTRGEIVSSAAIVGGVVYVGSNDGNLYALDQQTGAKKWAFQTGARVASSPAVDHDLVYFGSYDGNFYAVEAATGKVRWKFRNAGERRYAATHLHGSLPLGETMPDPFDVYLSSPAVSNGVVYIGSWDSYFYALDAATGKELWRFKTGEDPDMHNQVGIQSSAIVADGIVYFGCRDSNLYALDAATGKKLWSFNNKGSWVITSPVVQAGKLYFATSDTALLHVVDAKTGAPIDSLQFSWPIFSSPSIAGATLYLAGQDGKLVAVDLRTFKVAWTFQSEASRQNLATLSKPDGKPNYEAVFQSNFYDDMIVGVAKTHTVGTFTSSPVVSGSVVYIGSADGNLYALE